MNDPHDFHTLFEISPWMYGAIIVIMLVAGMLKCII